MLVEVFVPQLQFEVRKYETGHECVKVCTVVKALSWLHLVLPCHRGLKVNLCLPLLASLFPFSSTTAFSFCILRALGNNIRPLLHLVFITALLAMFIHDFLLNNHSSLLPVTVQDPLRVV